MSEEGRAVALLLFLPRAGALPPLAGCLHLLRETPHARNLRSLRRKVRGNETRAAAAAGPAALPTGALVSCAFAVEEGKGVAYVCVCVCV